MKSFEELCCFGPLTLAARAMRVVVGQPCQKLEELHPGILLGGSFNQAPVVGIRGQNPVSERMQCEPYGRHHLPIQEEKVRVIAWSHRKVSTVRLALHPLAYWI